jgi:hypothetical protein
MASMPRAGKRPDRMRNEGTVAGRERLFEVGGDHFGIVET